MQSNRSPRAADPGGLLRQIETADKVLSFAKMILVAFAAIILWAARLQWNVADLQRQVTETNTRVANIEDDRRTKIKDNDAWRAAEEKADLKRDLQLEQLVQIVKTQGAQPSTRSR